MKIVRPRNTVPHLVREKSSFIAKVEHMVELFWFGNFCLMTLAVPLSLQFGSILLGIF